MKIIYIANIRIPTEKAHGVQIMSMCEAFANAGNDVTLVVPRRLNNIKSNPFEYYGVKENFKIKKLPTLDFIFLGKFGFWAQSFSFGVFSTFYSIFKKVDIIYSRDLISLYILSFFGVKKKLVFELHENRENFVIKRVLKMVTKIIVITQGLKDYCIFEYGVERDKILVAHDGVDLDKIRRDIDKSDSRSKIGIPQNKKIVLYVGSFFAYNWKGVDVVLEAAKNFKEDVIFLLVGGSREEIDNLKSLGVSDNVVLVEHQTHKNIQYYMSAADVLLLPNKKGDEVSEKYTSPMKMFEYMASGRAIVASDLPSIREVLNEENSILVSPNDKDRLSDGIKNVLNNNELADRISKKSFVDVQGYSWRNRVKNILSFINLQ